MEVLFSNLPTLIFFFIIASRIIKKMTEQAQEFKLEKPNYEPNKDDNIDLESDLENKNNELNKAIMNQKNKEDEINISSKDNYKSVTKEKKNNLDKIKEEEIKDTKNKIIDQKSIEKDILKGLIFKEILDKPRAKRPYNFKTNR